MSAGIGYEGPGFPEGYDPPSASIMAASDTGRPEIAPNKIRPPAWDAEYLKYCNPAPLPSPLDPDARLTYAALMELRDALLPAPGGDGMTNPPTDDQVATAVELMFDAFDAAGMAERGKYSVGFYARPLDDIEASVANMARALLAAGWRMPVTLHRPA
ncbi:MAG: hypothetical protein JWO67_3213 [Streptosporangiaceae bacterium]|nr:hypothetical protein [Streptosporangiaceae bacterium]